MINELICPRLDMKDEMRLITINDIRTVLEMFDII